MRRLSITIVDLVKKGPARTAFSRLMNANLASIMPQAIGVWCEELGHEVRYICYTGFEPLGADLFEGTDVLFVCAFTRSAQLAYALSNIAQQKGAVTVLGGPHSRCYPEDAAKYFDYVLGFTDRSLVDDVLRNREPQRPSGIYLSAARQPASLPGARERWRFIEQTIAKAPILKLVPMIGSMGCPYKCSFCIDSTVDYQPLPFDQIREDLQFLTRKMRKPRVAWHDPNFGVRFNDYMNVIEEAVPAGRIDFVAESSLSLLSEPNLGRLRRNGFKGMLPGVESWYDFGNKSKTGRSQGWEKVRNVADHINRIMSYIPFVQVNFVLGLDSDRGAEPFEMTKRFIDLAPGAYPAFSLLTAYGRAAPLNLELQRAGRVLPVPFDALNSHQAMNVAPLNYDWVTFYDHVIDLTRYALSGGGVYKRLSANSGVIPKCLNFVRARSSGRVKQKSEVRDKLASDRQFRAFFEGETKAIPKYFEERVRRSLGPFWAALPAGALEHDPNAWSNSVSSSTPKKPTEPRGPYVAGADTGPAGAS